MQKETITIHKLTADTGNVIYNTKTQEVFGEIVYLAKTEAVGHYDEMDKPVEGVEE